MGFRVSPGRNRKLFSELGFRGGDLLTSINGSVPNSPGDILNVFDGMQSGQSVTVEVTRRGKPITLTLNAP